MGAIKDITDLTIKLLETKEARKFAAEIMKIQSLTAVLQSEQANIVEKNTELLTENSSLKQKLSTAQQNIDALSAKHRQEIAKFNITDQEDVTPPNDFRGGSREKGER